MQGGKCEVFKDKKASGVFTKKPARRLRLAQGNQAAIAHPRHRTRRNRIIPLDGAELLISGGNKGGSGGLIRTGAASKQCSERQHS